MPGRESAEAAGWVYGHSAALGMDYATRPVMGGAGVEVMTADKVRYSPAEVAILSAAGMEASLGAHLVKRVFQGEIVDAGPTAIRPPPRVWRAAPPPRN